MNTPDIISTIITKLQSGSGLVLLHQNADIDALGSAIALKLAFPNLIIGTSNKISQLGRNFLQKFPKIEINYSLELENSDNIIVLDTSQPLQLGISKDLLKNPIIIDHHTFNNIWSDAIYYCDETKSSCAEMILEILRFIDFAITPEISFALLAGILVDTGHFKYGNQNSLRNFAYLLDVGKHSISDIYDIFDNSNSESRSQRIAHLKGAQRLRFVEVKNYLIAVSQLSSFEASMCKHLLILGADLAFVGAQRETEVRISGRASGELVKKGLHLGKIFQQLGSELNFEGGGHAGAAGLNGDGDADMALNACLRKLESELDCIRNDT